MPECVFREVLRQCFCNNCFDGEYLHYYLHNSVVEEKNKYNIPNPKELRQNAIIAIVNELNNTINSNKVSGGIRKNLTEGQKKYYDELKEIYTQQGYSVSLYKGQGRNSKDSIFIEW
jgi:hypothetical protein